MRSPLFILLLLGVVAAVLAVPKSPRNPIPGEVYRHTETGERIVIDDVGRGSEIAARYRERNRELGDMGLSDRGVVSGLIVPVYNRADSLRTSFSYLGEETVTADPGEVYIFDGDWHGEVPVTVAYIHSLDWLKAKYERVSAAP